MWCRYFYESFSLLEKKITFLFFFILFSRERRDVGAEGGGCNVLTYAYAFHARNVTYYDMTINTMIIILNYVGFRTVLREKRHFGTERSKDNV